MASKANFQHLGFENISEGIHCYWVKEPLFGFHWHYHPELEITYVHQGYGVRMVGNSINTFENGDFVFLGSNLPHTWITDKDFNKSEENIEVIVLQFAPTLFSKEWLALLEIKNIKNLFQQANRGIAFSETTRKKAANILLQMVEKSGLERFTLMLHLLDLLGQENSMELLASHNFLPPLNSSSEKRFFDVCQFIHEEFTNPIRLEEAAKIANMNTTAFCRFFKKSTGQSFVDYVTDLRIGRSCNLLLDQKKMSISQVAYESGFRSQAVVNKAFLKRKKITPREFRKIS